MSVIVERLLNAEMHRFNTGRLPCCLQSLFYEGMARNATNGCVSDSKKEGKGG